MEDEVLLVSESEKSLMLHILGAFGCFALFTFFLSMALVEVNWLGALGSLIGLFGTVKFATSNYKKKYYFGQNFVTIADHNDEYIDEIKISAIHSWNDYSEKDNHIIIIKSENKCLIFEKNDYRNFYAIRGYFNKLDIKRDEKLKDGIKMSEKEVVSKFDEKIVALIFLLSIMTLLLFWSIISTKKESNETQHFYGYITDIQLDKKHNEIDIELSTYPNIHFEFKNAEDVYFFKGYNYNNGKNTYVNMGKKIKIGVLKSDYDWKIKNEFIHSIDINTTSHLDVTNYEMIDR